MDTRCENGGGSWTISYCYPTAGFANDGGQNLGGLLPGSLKRTADWLKHTNFFELNSMQLAITLHSCIMSDMARFVQEYTTVWLRAL